ncbi:MAG: ammonium transporter [Mailhella sp.]|nr:ammonium transporter [Mailhella sp.]
MSSTSGGTAPIRSVLTLLAIAILAPAAAFADDGGALSQRHGNVIITLLGGMLVMFMQPGFALVECGLTRAKNAGNILMKNFLDFSLGTPLFFLVGFGVMFGANATGFFGNPSFCLSFADPATEDGLWAWTFFFFQTMFCATAATIVSGCVAERTDFKAYILVSVIVSVFIYPVSGSWCWNGLFAETKGWIESLGFIDFAGSTVVHSVGGWIGLAGAICVGPRLGKYTADGRARAIPGHNIPLVALGVLILWFAWFGFNCCSTTAADGTVGYIGVNTCLAACMGFVTAMVTIWFITGKPDPSMSMNGCLAGLVGITAGCFEVSPSGSIFIGAMCGVVVVFSVLFLDQKLRVDDPVGAVSVHGVCGTLGSILVAFFAAPGYGESVGILYGGDAHILLVQIIGAFAVAVWAFVTGFIAFKIVDKVVGLRVSREVELKGLDITEHGTDVYSGFQIFSNE